MIAIPVYVREQKNFELLWSCIQHWKQIEDDIWLYVNAWEHNYDVVSFDTDEDVTVYLREVNSVAGAWDDAIVHAYNRKLSEVIICNQDIEYIDKQMLSPFYTDTITAARTKDGQPDFALFAVNPTWIKETFGTLRPFDEGFEGAYFEDNDFRYQCKLKGFEIPTIPLDFKHYGSGVLKHDEEAAKENEQRFRKNHIRYINKWGGIRGAETFKTPFNK